MVSNMGLKMNENFKLPQMTSYLFAPWFPMPRSNLDIIPFPPTGSGKKRDDLPDDAQLHDWHGYWTLEELYKYGALPAKENENGF